MNIRLIWKDMVRSKAVTITILLFIAAASMLLSLAAILAVDLSGSIDRLMNDAKTPHFLQMHSGDPEADRLEAFAGEQPSSAQFQLSKFLNIDSSQIVINGTPLAGSLQDNGFCVQNNEFDFLLDMDYNRVHPSDGELYVPIYYSKDGTLKQGDSVTVNGVAFTVAGFVRDSQMNSALAYSKRFVVSADDYARLEPAGALEYLIEFRLNDMKDLGTFTAAYSAAGLPANGPTLTWPLFCMISAMSDGIMIAVILMVSILVVLIAFFCIRFTLLAKIEDDYREIGVMKAIGMRNSDIMKIYMTTYAAIAAAGCILGFFIALLFHGPMTESIRQNLGDSGKGMLAQFLGLAGILFLFVFILLYIRGNLKRFRRISAAGAIRSGAVEKQNSKIKTIHLSRNTWLSTNMFLGFTDVMSRKRLYGTMLIVIVLASFMIIVPQNLYHTVSADDFVTYMGVGQCDLRIDIQQDGGIREKSGKITDYMASDSSISKFALLSTKTFGVRMKDGTTENIKVELGDHAVFPVQYASGWMPASTGEIALSSINAEEWGKAVGDQLTLVTKDGEKLLTVCGIYSDITNGGKTAKAVFEDNATDTAWSVICADLNDSRQLHSKQNEYKELFSFAKVSGIDEYVAQTFGQTLRSVHTAAWTAAAAAVTVTLLVTLLFLKLLIAKNRYSIAVMKAMGFTNGDVRSQYGWRAILVLTLGIVLGTILAGTLGETLAGAAISSFGAAGFCFVTNPLVTYLFCPLAMLLSAAAAIAAATSRIGNLHISELIKE